MLIESCKEIFGEPVNYYEAATVVDADYKIFSENLPDKSILLKLFENLPKRDNLEISIKDESDTYFKSLHNEIWMDEYIKFCSEQTNGEEINIHIHIEKQILDDTVSVYDFERFVTTLEEKNF